METIFTWTGLDKSCIFLAFTREPAVSCVNCHAPLDRQSLLPLVDNPRKLPGGVADILSRKPITEEGINCAVCHVRNGKIYASKKPDALTEKRSIHPIHVDTELAKPSFCASCHQFHFPGKENPVSFTNIPMQETVKEFYKSKQHQEGKTCQTCHFQNEKKESFHGSKKLKKEDFKIYLVNESQSYKAHFTTDQIAHSWPSGDLYRQIRVTITMEDGTQRIFFHQRNLLPFEYPSWGNDSRLLVKEGRLDQDYETGDKKPVHCRIEIHKQGGIEGNIKMVVTREMYEKNFLRLLYSGPCDRDNFTLLGGNRQ